MTAPAYLSEVEIRELLTDQDISDAYPVIRQLRPHLDRGDLIGAVNRQRREGFRCVGLFVEGVCLGFAGFRIQHMLAHGRSLYVDDLVTEQNEHVNGYGTRLMEWLSQLDSGCQRREAHAFYFRRGLRITSFHFGIALHPGEHG